MAHAFSHRAPRSASRRAVGHVRRGTFLLMCMALVATLTVLAFAFLRTVQSAHTSGDATTRDLLSREAALDGFHHAAEYIMRGYVGNPSSTVINDPNSPVGSTFTYLDSPAIAPFIEQTGAYAPGPSGSVGSYAVTNLDHDDVSPEHHVWDPTSTFWWCGYDFGGGAFPSNTTNPGRGRYYEPSFYNLPTSSATTVPTVPVAFTDFGATMAMPARADGLFLDNHFVRLANSVSAPLTARQQARFRLRYAVNIIDLDGAYLINSDPALDYTKITDTDPNNITDPVAKRVVATMEAVPTNWLFAAGGDTGTSGGLRYQHVYMGRGWASNYDSTAANHHVPQTFPLMYRDPGDAIEFLNGGWASSKSEKSAPGASYNIPLPRPNPLPGYAPNLYSAVGTSATNAALGPYGLKWGGEVLPAKTSGYWNGAIIMNHVLTGPAYSFRNARIAAMGGETNTTDYNGDGGIGFWTGVLQTPFGENEMPGAIPGSGSYNGSTLTGTGTKFSQYLHPGSVVSVGNQTRVVSSVSGDTSADMTTAFNGSGVNASMALVSRYAGVCNVPITVNVMTMPVNVGNGILAGYVPSGVMKQTWGAGVNNSQTWNQGAYYPDAANLVAHLSGTAVTSVTPVNYINTSASPPIMAPGIPQTGQFYYDPGAPTYYNPIYVRFYNNTDTSMGFGASATVSLDANGSVTAINMITGGSYTTTPKVQLTEQFESHATWDLFVPALSKAFGPGYGNYAQPASSDSAGNVISPDFHVAYERPADNRPATVSYSPSATSPANSPGLPYPSHPTADAGYRNPRDRYPGPLCINGFDAFDNPRFDNLGLYIDVSDNSQLCDPYAGGGFPGGYFLRQLNSGLQMSMMYDWITTDQIGLSGGAAWQWGTIPYIHGGTWWGVLSPAADSFYFDMLSAMSSAIAVTRAQWMEYSPGTTNWTATSWNGNTTTWKNGPNNLRAENLHDLDALFLAQLGIDINNPAAPVVYTGPVNFTAGPAPRPGGWNGNYSINHHLPTVNIAMMAQSPNFTEIVTGADNIPATAGFIAADGSNISSVSINGISATAGLLTETMELMLNDFRLSLLGSNPGYQATFQALDFNGDGRVACSAFPSAFHNPTGYAGSATMAASGPNTVDTINVSRGITCSATEAALHIDQVVGATEAPLGSTSATTGAVTISSNAAYVPFCINGNFDMGKSRFYRILVRGALWDNLRSMPMSESLLDSVLCVDPAEEAQEYAGDPNAQHPGKQYSTHVIYQRWWFDKYRGALSRSY
jgi:hypothetical protein